MQPQTAQTAYPDALAMERKRIDEIDEQLVDLLNQRAACALAIARAKGAAGMPAYAPEREDAVLKAVGQRTRGPLDASVLKQIFTEIIAACRMVQRPLSVAYLGPESTFSHQAAMKRFGAASSFEPQKSVSDVFEEVERGRCQVGVVPVENSSEGGVNVTLDLLAESDLQICGEIFSPIEHVLMVKEGSMEEIKKVYSHPQALAQCRAWLARNVPQAELVECTSTAAAAQQAADEPRCGAIGCSLAARRYGLGILAKGIQDREYNYTRFFVLGDQGCPPTGTDKTSLVFVAAHQPGSLARALEPFSRRGINMTRIESRPSRVRPWTYAFFVDLEGHLADDEVSQAIAELDGQSDSLRVLGSYPAGDPRV